jgi:Arc/MetJ-type ribon-helix-helix transcriptional regulator
MPVITVRISDEEKRQLRRRGRISDVIREAIRFYINSRKREKALRKLEELQERYKVKTTVVEDLKLIKEDRAR